MKFLRENPKFKFIHAVNTKRYNKSSLKKFSRNTNFADSSLRRGIAGVKVLENCKLRYKQLESIRRLILPYTKNYSRVWFRGDFSTPLTAKSLGTRMGKGKGSFSHWVSVYKRGSIFFEFDFISDPLKNLELFKKLKFKLPFKFCIILRNQT